MFVRCPGDGKSCPIPSKASTRSVIPVTLIRTCLYIIEAVRMGKLAWVMKLDLFADA